MMLEKTFRAEVIAALENRGGHVTNHEDSWQPGIADLSFGLSGVDYWLELKVAEPIGAEGDRIKLGFSFQQATWLKKRFLAGNGRVYGLVRVWCTSSQTAEYWLYGAESIRSLTDTVAVSHAMRETIGMYRTLNEALKRILA